MDTHTNLQVPFLTVQQVHEALGGVVAQSTLYRHLHSGEIPCMRLGGRCYVPAWWLEERLAVGRS